MRQVRKTVGGTETLEAYSEKSIIAGNLVHHIHEK